MQTLRKRCRQFSVFNFTTTLCTLSIVQFFSIITDIVLAILQYNYGHCTGDFALLNDKIINKFKLHVYMKLILFIDILSLHNEYI